MIGSNFGEKHFYILELSDRIGSYTQTHSYSQYLDFNKKQTL